MERFECCEWKECVDKCEDCESYGVVKTVLEKVNATFFSIWIERQILAEVEKCNDVDTLKRVVYSLGKERHAKFYQYTINKINDRIRLLTE
jgi:hypothetical protein